MNKDLMKKKLLMASFVSALFFVSWDYFILKPLSKQAKENKINIEKQITKDDDKDVIKQEIETKIIPVIQEKIIKIENEYLIGELSTKGLKFNKMFLKKYKESLNSEKFHQLLKDDYSINFGWLSTNRKLDLPDEESVWEVDNLQLHNNTKITLTFKNAQGIIFKNIISLDDKYAFNIEQIVENNTEQEIKIQPFYEIRAKHIEDKRSLNQLMISGVFDNDLKEMNVKKIEKRNYEFDKYNWFSISDKYWVTSVISNNKENITTNFLKSNNVVKAQAFSTTEITVKAQSNYSIQNRLFIGAKDLKILDEYAKKFKILLFDRIVDFGNLYILTKPLYLLLNLFNKFVKNFGIAILLLTVLVKMILYPMTKKSLVSMAKMKKVQPEFLKIQKQYKNDKLGLSLKLQQLYKENDISPFAGIVPMFIQIPIFFALYRVFLIAIDMRFAPFYGYLKDLSSADPTSLFNLFGLLPFNAVATVGFLPCLMAITMWFQQKLNDQQTKSAEADSGENDMMKSMNSSMKWLPLIFLFIFASLPSGLVLYWIYNNVITILQQLYINKYINSSNRVVKIN